MLVGLGLAVVKTAWETSHVRVTVHDDADPVHVAITGNATFLRLPTILTTLDGLPDDRRVRLDLGGLRHVDHACRTALDTWIETQNRTPTSACRSSPHDRRRTTVPGPVPATE